MPLLMDLNCPVEFVSTEVTRDSSGHAQAYLTFRNLGRTTVEGICAMVTLENERGQSVDIRPLRYRGIKAPGRSLFTLCIAADRLPYFENARALIHEVYFSTGDAYHLDEDALQDCTVNEEPPGEKKAALIGVAGEDALCYASTQGDTWICLCGRYNENGSGVCMRCRRSRRQVFALTPERALEEYVQKKKQESYWMEADKIDAHRQEVLRLRRRRAAYKQRIRKEKRRALLRRILRGLIAAAAVAGVMYLKLR